MQLSRLRLSAYDLERLPPQESLLFRLIRHKTKHISIKLLGHPSRKVSWIAWAQGPESPTSDDEGSEDLEEPTIMNGRAVRIWKGDWQPAMQNWRILINQKLKFLADNLPQFADLRSFSLEATCEDKPDRGPRWDYLYAETVAHLVRQLPTGLSALLLDLGGTKLITEENHPVHICSVIGERLEDFRCVRLRTRNICPAILQNSQETTRLEKLVFKLHQPWFPGSPESSGPSNEIFDASPCSTSANQITKPELLREMVCSSVAYGRRKAGKTLKIGFRDPRGSGINVNTIDAIANTVLSDPSELFCCEEVGRYWDFSEEFQSLQPIGGFDWLLID